MTKCTVTAAAVAMAVVCPAYADTHVSVGAHADPEDGAMRERFDPDEELELAPSLVLGTPSDRARLDRIKLAVRGRAATLTLAVSTRELTSREAVTTLDVPTGARVTGLAVTIGGERSEGAPFASRTATERYREIVVTRNDPALLEHTESTRRHDRLTLRVFPITKTTPATVEIQLDLPASRVVELDPGEQTIAKAEIEVDGQAQQYTALKSPRTIELPAVAARDDWMTEEPAPRKYITPDVSLFAAAAATPMPTVHWVGAQPTASVYVDKTTIHSLVKLQLPRLRHCYMREVQRDPSLAGSADLHFTIGADGGVSDISVDGTLRSDDVKTCIAAEAATWAFHRNNTPTRVNYPLAFAAR